MTRQLRPRTSRPSYAFMAGFDDIEDEAGPSTLAAEEEGSSGSDFALDEPEVANPEGLEDDDEDAEGDVLDEDVLEVETTVASLTGASTPNYQLADNFAPSDIEVVPPPKAKGKGKAKAGSTIKSVGGPGTSLVRSSKRQMYVLPAPSVHHRHRAVPLFSRSGRVERLTLRPSLFGPAPIVLTNSFTQSPKVTDRVNKSWGYNVGSGPLWEMVEDRGWYKEAVTIGNDVDSEAKRRPRVWADLCVKNGWRVFSESDAAPYLPTDDTTTDEGNLQSPPPVHCYFGHITSQTLVEMNMLESHPMAKFLPESKAHIFNAGAPIWGLDWCPIHVEDRAARSYKQYLAVAPFPSRSHSPDIGTKVPRPAYACIQIWSLAPTRPIPANRAAAMKNNDPGIMKCEMIICVDAGPAHEIKWCPLASHDSMLESKRPRKLGILAGTFEDGSLSIYSVPQPEDVRSPDHDPSKPVCISLPEPIIRIELEETSCWTFDWANSELVAIGTTNGIIAVYDLGPSLKSWTSLDSETISDLLPTHYLTVHQSAIRALAWIQAPPCWPSGAPRVDGDPTVVASGGYDGMECMTDIREGHGSVMNRTRDVINALAFSPFAGGPITMDHENTVKAYSASPSMLGRGHSLLEPQGPVWSVHASQYHPQLAVGAADGSCSTTNTLRSTRRGGSVPFFVHKLYQMDYSRNTKEYRMLDRFLPQETFDRPTVTRAANNKSKGGTSNVNANPPGTGAWPREVGVHRVSWNSGNGLAASGLLASATASGICRVDVLWGRWIKDKLPYGGIEQIRGESDGDGDAMDVDSEASDVVSS